MLSACASKGSNEPGLSSEQLSAEQTMQAQYKKSIDLLKSLENQDSRLIESGAYKANEELNAIYLNLQKINETMPFYPGPLLNLGISSWWLGEVEEAKSYFERVIAFESELDRAMSSNSLSQEHSDAIAENLDMFRLPAFNYLGLVSREQGQFEQAEGFYRKALALDAEHRIALRNLAILLDLYLGRLPEALPLYEKYQSLLEEPDPQVKDWIFDLKNRL